MIPALNQHGVLPVGIHDATLDEVRDRFGYNPLRMRLLRRLDKALANWRGKPCWDAVADVYIDGSFLSDKPAPNDIECAVAISWDARKEAACGMIAAVTATREQTNRVVDCYWFIHGMPVSDFSRFFQYMRRSDADARQIGWLPNTPMKGIVRLSR